MSPDHRRLAWLRWAGIATLVLAAVLLAVAIHERGAPHRAGADVRERAEEMMNRIEAESARIANAAEAP